MKMLTRRLNPFAVIAILMVMFFAGLFASQAKANVQCAILSGMNAIFKHQCPPDIRPARCIARKGVAFVAGYYQCANPLVNLRNFQGNPYASIRSYRTPAAASSFQRARVFNRSFPRVKAFRR